MTINSEISSQDEAYDQILAQLCDEFLSDARERIEEIFAELDKCQSQEGDAEATLLVIRRQCHNLKGMGGSFGFPTITLIAHRLEDYLARTHMINAEVARDIDAYCQRLLDIVSIGKDPGPDGAALIIRTLPTLSYFQVDDVTANGKEVFLVTPSKTIGAFVGRELAACGYKVTRFSNAWEALQFAASTKPDMVISAAVMEVIDGLDFACALAAMKATRDIPVAILTSFDTGSRELERLPASAVVIRHGESFSEELAQILSVFENGGLCAALPA